MGIIESLRQRGFPWLGRKIAKQSGTEKELKRSKVAVQRKSTTGLTLLPWIDQSIQDTPAARVEYRKMLRDPNVKSQLLTKVYAVASLNLSVPPPDPKNAKDRYAAEMCRAMTMMMKDGLRGVAENTLIPLMLDGFLTGEKIAAQVQRGEYAGKWYYEEIAARHENLYQWEINEQGKVTAVVGQGPSKGERYDPGAFIITRYLSLYGNPYGMSDLAAAYQSYWRLDTLIKLWHTYFKNQNGPFVVAKYPGERDDLRDLLDEVCQAARSGGYAVVPEGTIMDLLNIANAGNASYKEAVEHFKRDIILSISWAVLQSVEGEKTGSRAGMQVHQSQSNLPVWLLAEVLCSILNQCYRDWCDLNCWGFSDYPKAQLGGVDDADLVQSVQVDEALARIGQITGFEHDVEELSRVYGRNLKRAPKETQPAMPPGGAASGTFQFADVAGPNKDAQQAERFLAEAIQHGTDTLTELCRKAFKRIKGKTPVKLFTDAERKELAESIAATRATAELLGRAKIRERQKAAQRGRRNFTDEPTRWESFADNKALPPMVPEKALSYFTSLYPSMAKLPAFTQRMTRESFTLAAATEEKIVGRVQKIIADSIEQGASVLEGQTAIRDLLESAGVSPSNPQYSEMVFRTNALDSLNEGVSREMQDPDVADDFPVWRYDGIEDGREGDDHRPKFGKYFPNSATFAEVRGERPFNCRCVGTPVYVDDWKALQKQGVSVETSW